MKRLLRAASDESEDREIAPVAGSESNPLNPSDVSKLSEPSCTATSMRHNEKPAIAQPKSDLAQRIYDILKRFVGADEDDLKVIAIWCLHTWLLPVLWSTPRLLIDSAVCGSGKSTLMSWIKRFSHDAVFTSTITSSALLVRLSNAQRTILVDEADRSLNKDNPLAKDFIAIINQGYKNIDSTRPTLVQGKKKDRTVKEFETFCAAAFAGNNPNIAADTASRCIRVFLYPSDNIEESDWELIEKEPDIRRLPGDIAKWASAAEESVKVRPPLPKEVRGRQRELWLPLARVAQTQEGDFCEVICRMAVNASEQARIDAEEGLVNDSPHVLLLRDIAQLWSQHWPDEAFLQSSRICQALAAYNGEIWGRGSSYGSSITGKRLAMMLRKAGIKAMRFTNADGQQCRGYSLSSFRRPWKIFRVWERLKASEGIDPPKGFEL